MGSWRHDLIPVLSLTGVILDAIGGLYLAYDLLGGKHGPLRTITKSVSYGIRPVPTLVEENQLVAVRRPFVRIWSERKCCIQRDFLEQVETQNL